MMAAASGPDFAEVAQRLNADVAAVVADILPAGTHSHGQWCVGSIAGEKGQSLRVQLTGPRRGLWIDHDGGQRGDALDLVAAVLYGGNKRDAFEWGKARYGLGGYPAPARRTEPPPIEPEPDPEEKKRAARNVWVHAQASILDTPAEAYLAGRGIAIRRMGRQPRALRFHPTLWCEEIKGRLPALVAAINSPEGEHIGTHRIFLAEAEGRWRKAPLQQPKKAMGVFRGGWIPLWRGQSGKAIGEAPEGDVVAVGEGIETCLSVALACPELRVLCAVSGSNLRNLALPAAIGELIVLADNDGNNQSSAAKVAAAVERFQAEGRVVRIALPDVPGADWNDVLQGVEG